MPFQVNRNGQSYGPYTLDDLRRYLATGNILPDDLATGEGYTTPIRVADLLQHPAAPPPPPAAPFGTAPWNQPETFAPYAAPTGDYPWFPVSTTKFIVMMLCTFNLYAVYWSFKQWRRLEPSETWLTFVRALFLGITNFMLFPSVKTRAELEGEKVSWNPILMAIFVLVISAFGYARNARGLAALSFLAFLPYLPVVGTIAQLNARVAGTVAESPNSSFSGINIAGIVIGGILLLLSLLGFAMQLAGLAN